MGNQWLTPPFGVSIIPLRVSTVFPSIAERTARRQASLQDEKTEVDGADGLLVFSLGPTWVMTLPLALPKKKTRYGTSFQLSTVVCLNQETSRSVRCVYEY